MDRRWVAILVVGLVVVGVVAAIGLSAAQDEPLAQEGSVAQEQPTAAVVAAGETNQPPRVVAALPAESVTEFEADPFEPQRVRSSTVRVRRVALIYSDGTIEVKTSP